MDKMHPEHRSTILPRIQEVSLVAGLTECLTRWNSLQVFHTIGNLS